MLFLILIAGDSQGVYLDVALVNSIWSLLDASSPTISDPGDAPCCFEIIVKDKLVGLADPVWNPE